RDITAGTPGPLVSSFDYASAPPLVITGSSNNLLAVDFVGGTNPIPGSITFNAGAAVGDALEVWNGGFTNLGSTYAGAAAGTVRADALGTIDYSGVDGLSLGGSKATGPSYGSQTTTAANVAFNLASGDGDNQAILEDNGNPTDGVSQIRSGNGTFATTT